MFRKDFVITGTHGKRMKKLTDFLDLEETLRLFERNVDVLMIAPIIGFLYERTAESNKEDGFQTKILTEQIVKESEELNYALKLLIILDKKNSDLQEKLRIAFDENNLDENKVIEEHFLKYVRGGIDVIYEKVLWNAKDEEDLLELFQEMIEEIYDRYFNDNIEDIDNLLISLARG